MSNIIPIAAAVVSLVGSAAINWFTRVRGASIYMRLLRPPTRWTIAWKRIDPNTGVVYLGDRMKGDDLYITAEIPVVIGNSGPRAGVIFDVRVVVGGFPGPWEVPSNPTDVAVDSVASNDENTKSFFVELKCARALLRGGLRLLRETPPSLRVRVTYRRHAWLHDQKKHTKWLRLAGPAMRRSIAVAASHSSINLDWCERSDEVAAALREALGPVKLSTDDMDSLVGAVKWVADRPVGGISFQVQGEDSSATIVIRDETDHRSAELAADGQRWTLHVVGEAYHGVSEHVRGIVRAAYSWRSLGE